MVGADEGRALAEIAEAYVDGLATQWPTMLGPAALALAMVWLWPRLDAWLATRAGEGPDRSAAAINALVLAALIGLGLQQALARASCLDDAYISLRYAEHLLAGDGLVWNLGERVEGYSNFLWTLILAGLIGLTGADPPLLAVLASLAAFVANLLVVWRIGLRLAPPARPGGLHLPWAVALLVTQGSFTDFATTGLETGFASCLVDLGLLALLDAGPHDHDHDHDRSAQARDPIRSCGAAGLCWILATSTRPDHALFYAVGAAVVAGLWLRPLWQARRGSWRDRWRAGLGPMLAYAAPFALWLVHTAWRWTFYGATLPNTYFAKSAALPYYDQGLIYALSFHLASHLWLLLLVLLLWLSWPRRPPRSVAGRRLAAFVIPAVLIYEGYVLRLGGDFMFGRFYVVVLPLLYLAAQQLLTELAGTDEGRVRARARPAALIAAALLAAGTGDLRLIGERELRWQLSDEPSFYRVRSWSPLTVDHPNEAVGRALGRIGAGLEQRGFAAPVIACPAIGLIGFHSKLPLIDRIGLTDATVAHQPLEQRGRPGHEKRASLDYLRSREVMFLQGNAHPKWLRPYTEIRWVEGDGGRPWQILIYDPRVLTAIRELEPAVRLRPIEPVIDGLLARPPGPARRGALRRRDAELRRYYFDHHPDPTRAAAWDRALQE